MLPTFAVADVLLADLRLAGKSPERGDIIVFKVADVAWIKRVLALPGDRIAFKARQPWLNGQALPWEDAGNLTVDTDSGQAQFGLRRETLPGKPAYRIALKPDSEAEPLLADIPETIVPPGQIFVVGDNRDNSMDSRIASMSPVLITDMVGRIVCRLRPNFVWLVPPDEIPGLK